MVSKADERFPWRQRIVRSSDFRSLYHTGRRLDAGKFVLFGRPNGLGFHRLGLTVSRKVGGAVVRNRVKRLFREIFRRFSADIPCHLDLVVNAKRECASVAYAALREEFLSAARRICR
ncbi:MAG: ribonuclease P protein component [Acidobacteriia bacterium]|nr:ribonuclease P protein component [Terriglobia bacterium]